MAKLETEREKTYQETLILLREHQEPPDVADSVREDKATSEVLSEESGKNQATQEAGPGDIAEPYEPKLRPTRVTVSSAQLNAKLTEAAVMKAFRLTYGGMVDIVPDIKIGNTFADAAITSPNKRIPDLLVDIRTVSSPSSARLRLDEAISWSLRAQRAAKKDLQRYFIPTVFLIVYDRPPSNKPGSDSDVHRLNPTTERVRLAAVGAFEDLQEVHLPLNVVIGSTRDLTPSNLSKVSWHTDRPRVIDLRVMQQSVPPQMRQSAGDLNDYSAHP
ncbi:hypothetical protein [Micromonospora sp. NBRC 107095]|uniref:hypothetical protein n=1 Tax=Micromonospora sp. NBRC 107095 TaxID=3032209 RepID=UPI00249FBB54|nr:hypothetical protein [Micromonospora sp. NBRC 107095]GLZ60126.1 hypothetical protein Misp05_37020 [Micromonospora sp. NBRC 107095]